MKNEMQLFIDFSILNISPKSQWPSIISAEFEGALKEFFEAVDIDEDIVIICKEVNRP